jgi:tRNA (guanine37-N1)-methyltransferase
VKKNLKFIMMETLEPKELKGLIQSYDVIGDIAIVRVPEELKSQRLIIAENIMRTQKHVKTVLRQTSAVSGEYRLRQLEYVAGENRTETLHRESGCVFKVDLSKCYFSPRLSFERKRIAKLAQPNETVVNMFAGVGAFSILMAKYSRARRVFSIDVNPVAVECMLTNIRLNRVQSQVVPILGDAKQVMRCLRNIANRVVMPLPEKAFEYLDCAVMALKPVKGWIHYYDFEHASKSEDPIGKVEEKIVVKLQKLCTRFSVSFGKVVRSIGPNWHQVVLDVEVSQK